ncbi:MAG: hypothetical protein LBB45_03285, partial [Methanobrevibacter sp.]|jgi:hypothetical protein|nr:hypothetical protein [Candidatus Methanovirga basalitermitum]
MSTEVIITFDTGYPENLIQLKEWNLTSTSITGDGWWDTLKETHMYLDKSREQYSLIVSNETLSIYHTLFPADNATYYLNQPQGQLDYQDSLYRLTYTGQLLFILVGDEDGNLLPSETTHITFDDPFTVPDIIIPDTPIHRLNITDTGIVPDHDIVITVSGDDYEDKTVLYTTPSSEDFYVCDLVKLTKK